MQSLTLSDQPHRRYNPLTGEWVLVSPQRAKRPWQGKIEATAADNRPPYDPQCYLCPGNQRAEGAANPDYTGTYVFENDFAALLKTKVNTGPHTQHLLQSEPVSGICKVIAFSPRHDLTLPELTSGELLTLVDTWCEEFAAISKNPSIKYIQIFENKGEIMGCSNPHPHGQIWAGSFIPNEVEKEDRQQEVYFYKGGHTLLSVYLEQEQELQQRIVCQNDDFAVLVPYWAVWPFETMIVSKRAVQNILSFDKDERRSLADILAELTTRYDNLFQTSFPYSAGMHQAPVNHGNRPWWHWHMHFYPPLLRSATIKKFMVGYEMLAGPQRDITPEQAAERLRHADRVHYKNKLTVEERLV